MRNPADRQTDTYTTRLLYCMPRGSAHRGIKTRSLCHDNAIHKTSRLSEAAVEEAVAEAVAKVCTSLMHCYFTCSRSNRKGMRM